MKALGIGKIVRNLKFEKALGYTLPSLFISLLIMHLWGKTIACATSNHFHGLSSTLNKPFVASLIVCSALRPSPNPWVLRPNSRQMFEMISHSEHLPFCFLPAFSAIFPPYSAPHFFNSFSLEIGSEIVLTSSELISTSSELISTSSELISTSVECLKMGFSV